MHLSDSLPTDPLALMHRAIVRLERAYSPGTIRVYFADFASFTAFCKFHSQTALPADSQMVFSYIAHISTPGRSSVGVRRTMVGSSANHLLNRMADPTKDPDVRIATKRACDIEQETLNLPLTKVGTPLRAITGFLGDVALLRLAYATRAAAVS